MSSSNSSLPAAQYSQASANSNLLIDSSNPAGPGSTLPSHNLNPAPPAAGPPPTNNNISAASYPAVPAPNGNGSSNQPRAQNVMMNSHQQDMMVDMFQHLGNHLVTQIRTETTNQIHNALLPMSNYMTSLAQDVQLIRHQQTTINANQTNGSMMQFTPSPSTPAIITPLPVNSNNNNSQLFPQTPLIPPGGGSGNNNSPAAFTGPSTNNIRRQSSIADMLNVNPNNVHQHMQYIQTTPSYSHISLTKLEIPSLFDFILQSKQYQTAHRIQLPLGTLVSNKIRESICARRRDVTFANFLDLPQPQLLQILIDECRPKSMFEFQTCLGRYLKFRPLPQGYIPSVLDFEPMYNNLLVYRTLFWDLFDIMSQGNEHNIPECHNKDGGLIKIFLSKIPAPYGQNLFQSLGTTRFPDMAIFLDAFYAAVDAQYTQFQDSRRVNLQMTSSLPSSYSTVSSNSPTPRNFSFTPSSNYNRTTESFSRNSNVVNGQTPSRYLSNSRSTSPVAPRFTSNQRPRYNSPGGGRPFNNAPGNSYNRYPNRQVSFAQHTRSSSPTRDFRSTNGYGRNSTPGSSSPRRFPTSNNASPTVSNLHNIHMDVPLAYDTAQDNDDDDYLPSNFYPVEETTTFQNGFDSTEPFHVDRSSSINNFSPEEKYDDKHSLSMIAADDENIILDESSHLEEANDSDDSSQADDDLVFDPYIDNQDDTSLQDDNHDNDSSQALDATVEEELIPQTDSLSMIRNVSPSSANNNNNPSPPANMRSNRFAPPNSYIGNNNPNNSNNYGRGMLRAATDSNSPRGCFRMLMYNGCNQSNCTFKHDRDSLIRTYQYYNRLLNNSNYRVANTDNSSHSTSRFTNGTGTYNTSNNNRHSSSFNSHNNNSPQHRLSHVINDSPLLHGLHAIPVIDRSVADILPSFPNVLQNVYLRNLPEASLFSAVHRVGFLDLDNGNKIIKVSKVLFDTGALHGSYISETLVNQNYQYFRPYLREVSGQVTLADNKTKVPIKHVALLNIRFIDDFGVTHSAKVPFSVFNTSGNDIILGLPAIISSFSVLHKQMIDQGVLSFFTDYDLSPGYTQLPAPSNKFLRSNENAASISSESPDANFDLLPNRIPFPLLHSSSVNPDSRHLISPWTDPILPDAPEDIDTPIPCSFSDALHFMEVGYDEAVTEFLSLFDKHISPEFRKATKVDLLLQSKGKLVFVPSNWEGINGVPPIQLELKDGLPASMKPKARPINPKLFANAKNEFHRLCKYFYVPSDSPIASSLVVAPKATFPFIRLCGNYVEVNKYIVVGHYPIPNVLHAIERISRFSIFVDLDMTNSFHQFLLHPTTSALLSIQTLWGQVQPKFLPEGVGPASGYLQKHMSAIFADFEDWCIVIFDNILVLAIDYDDAYAKLEKILDRCIERNVFLKFTKSFLGVQEVKFFGYICRQNCYELSAERKAAIMSIPFPKTRKQMQSFLGAALFFRNFIPSYSSLSAQLNDMVRTNFNWTDESTWTVNYRSLYETFKQKLQDATTVFFPDYSLEWILRTDASLHGVGAVLLQVVPASNPNDPPIYQPIGFASKKFSPQATKWSTIEQEAYGIYFAVIHFQYYLRCKPFILETDHNNLLWMEASAVPKIIRWRVLLQSFTFMLRHIPGRLNVVADFLSRIHDPDFEYSTDPTFQTLILASLGSLFNTTHVAEDLDDDAGGVPTVDQSPKVDNSLISPKDLFSRVHGHRNLHHGTRRTWQLLNSNYPGHSIPYRIIADLVASCPICQKDRLGMPISETLAPVVRHLKPDFRRSILGVDTLTVTPTDKNGNSVAIVIVNHFTKLTAIYPKTSYDAISTATALFQYFCTFGMVDTLISDPGSDFMSDVVTHLMKWFGIHQKFSLVDWHQSNGVEPSNKVILRHLRALVMDERIADRWSDPTVLPLIQFVINNTLHSETNVVPFHAHFGSADATYFSLPSSLSNSDSATVTHEFVRLLDQNLQILQQISKDFQHTLAHERTDVTPAVRQNKYQPGDFVLWELDTSKPRPTKLTPRFLGPFIVISQSKNDVTCKHVNLGEVRVFHVTRLKIFHGTLDEAKHVALVDKDQSFVHSIVAYKGDPTSRAFMEFEVHWADNTFSWVPYSADISSTVHFESFCQLHLELSILLVDSVAAKSMLNEWRRSPITDVRVGDVRYINLRWFGSVPWYNDLPLPDVFHNIYVVRLEYKTYFPRRKLPTFDAFAPAFKRLYAINNAFVHMYGNNPNMDPTTNSAVVLVDTSLVARHPAILPPK